MYEEYENEIDLETIEVSIEHAQKAVKMMKHLERLTNNRDFKAVMLEGYFEKEPVRIAMLRAEPSFQKEEQQEQLLKDLDAIGRVRQYFNAVMQMGRMAEKEILGLEETRDEILVGDSGE